MGEEEEGKEKYEDVEEWSEAEVEEETYLMMFGHRQHVMCQKSLLMNLIHQMMSLTKVMSLLLLTMKRRPMVKTMNFTKEMRLRPLTVNKTALMRRAKSHFGSSIRTQR